MKTKLIASLLVAASATLAAPAFASGYGPAPSYNPVVGAPASQRGPSALTLAAERGSDTASAYGGVTDTHAHAGTRAAATDARDLYAHP